MITWTTPKSHLRSRCTRHIPIITRSNTNFWHHPQISAPSEIKHKVIEWTASDLLPKMCIFLKPYTIGSAPSYRAVSCDYLCIFSKRATMTVLWSNFVNNILIAYTLPTRDQGIAYKIGPRNRHWGAFAEQCINDCTIRHDTKGRCKSCIVLEWCTFGEVSCMQFILFLCALFRM